jgi:cytoskeleton protein RodZ
MSEQELGEQPGDIQGPTAGALLRRAREASGLHVAALAVAMKVPVKKLEALEADRYQDLPDVTFTRALAASVCRTLKIDATPILERLPQGQRTPLRRDDSNINAPFRVQRTPLQPSIFTGLSKPVLGVAALLLVGALGIVFWPDLKTAADRASAGNGTAQGERQGEPVVLAAADAASASASTTPGVPAVSETVALTPAPMLSAGPVGTALAPTPQGGASALSVVSGLDPAESIVVFKAGSGESWVQVTDAKGKNILRRTVQSGETVGAGGTPPLAVVVGRANAMEVTVRGQPFALGTHTRDNVAKFEVR